APVITALWRAMAPACRSTPSKARTLIHLRERIENRTSSLRLVRHSQELGSTEIIGVSTTRRDLSQAPCRLCARRPDLGRIVEEALGGDTVPVPGLQRQFIHQPRCPVLAGHLEHPVDDNAVTVDETGLDTASAHVLQSRQHLALMLDQRLPPDARRLAVLLHGRVRVIEIFD